MGKRKRRTVDDNTPRSSDAAPHAPQFFMQSEQRSSDQAESSTKQSQPSVTDAVDYSITKSPGHQSPLNQTHSVLLRHSRNPFGRHYSRRSSTNHADASPSNWNGSPAYDPKFPFKLDRRDFPGFPYRVSRDITFQKPERIRSSSLVLTTLSRDVRKMRCKICHKRLKKNPFVVDTSISSSDLSVVAVLVCGHAYHADCLEQKTSPENKQDPPCPLCQYQIS